MVSQSHIYFFADDCILFEKATLEVVAAIKQIINTYEVMFDNWLILKNPLFISVMMLGMELETRSFKCSV